MKKMNKLLSILLVGLLIAGSSNAQEYKVAKSTGRLEIKEVNRVSIEGYDGNEIIFTSKNQDRERDERAKGLRALSSLGLEDNSGIGLSIVDKGNVVEVYQLKKTDGPDVKIMVPRSVVVSYSHSSPYGSGIEIKNFAGTIEVSTVHNQVTLVNTSGPMSVKTVHGDIDAVLGSALKTPISLESVHGHVDVAIGADTKANLTLSTKWGEMLVDPALKIEIERTGNMVNYSDKIQGKVNGCGTDITLTSHHNNVYLRKK